MKTTRQLEKITKGIANHRRIKILFLIEQEPGLTLNQITTKLNANHKTISEHTLRLVHSGLIYKYPSGPHVRHELSPLGLTILKFLRMLE